ncbi:hypothetical protein DCS_00736 [Drechmeria coniospora]|uniref:Xylanolytic transcriptional activator regulatory domain-containing protein n=1 Tax=Drechmeria coniospora TaxID=98403 RepID=A0A151GR53_DRECN|nr:hypothetical protein DCS_00736 [Drechmeria coniospora]KYK59604.1 hypothetical protein DCS_00736 [Drechmeria coniospora]
MDAPSLHLPHPHSHSQHHRQVPSNYNHHHDNYHNHSPPDDDASANANATPSSATAAPSSPLSSAATSRSPVAVSHPLPDDAAKHQQELEGPHGHRQQERRHAESLLNGENDDVDDIDDRGHSLKKQKRNKPTLSCRDVIEAGPTVSPASEDNPIANMLTWPIFSSTSCADEPNPSRYELECTPKVIGLTSRPIFTCRERSRSVVNARRMTKPPRPPSAYGNLSTPNIADRGAIIDHDASSRGAVALSIGLLSNVPYSVTGASNVFGIGSEHPFANYWTCDGGLAEVILVLPDKIQADILLARYFECVDPVYPMIHRQTFYADYEHFWQLARPDRNEADASFVGLMLVMLALGTQFVTTTTPKERKQTAEFYASASNQALRMSSYLSTASLCSIQAMVLMTYFLINDNHASDGWAFAGILIRQAYAMGLHRDPNIGTCALLLPRPELDALADRPPSVTPTANPFEKQQRRKVWQAVLLQDTFMCVLLSLPPSATHTDVSVDDLLDDSSSIASSDPTDTAYIRASWMLASLVQERICSPRSLDLPICTTPRHKSRLVADFRAVYRSFPDVFRSWDTYSLTRLAATNKRVVRQTLFLTSNYFHNLMLVHASECPDVPVNIRGTLEAAHDAISAFFLLFTLLEAEARVWWVFQHRAFLEALCIGNVLREAVKESGGEDVFQREPLFMRARADIRTWHEPDTSAVLALPISPTFFLLVR